MGVVGPPPALEKYWERVTEGSPGEEGRHQEVEILGFKNRFWY